MRSDTQLNPAYFSQISDVPVSACQGQVVNRRIAHLQAKIHGAAMRPSTQYVVVIQNSFGFVLLQFCTGM